MDLKESDLLWEEIIQQFIKSKKTKVKFCRDNNIKVDQFYCRLKKLHPELIGKVKGGRSSVKNKITSFVPIKYEPPKEKIFHIHLQSGIKISFELLPELLPAFIQKLESGDESNISL